MALVVNGPVGSKSAGGTRILGTKSTHKLTKELRLQLHTY